MFNGAKYEINLNKLYKVVPPHIYVNNTEYNISDKEVNELFS